MDIAKTTVMVVDHTPTNVSNVGPTDRKCPSLRVLGTPLQPQGTDTGQRDTTKKSGSYTFYDAGV